MFWVIAAGPLVIKLIGASGLNDAIHDGETTATDLAIQLRCLRPDIGLEPKPSSRVGYGSLKEGGRRMHRASVMQVRTDGSSEDLCVILTCGS